MFVTGDGFEARPPSAIRSGAVLMEPEIARTLKRRRRTPGLSVAKFSGGVAAVRHDDYTTSSHLFQPKGFAVAADMLHVAEEEKQAVRVEVDNGKLNTLQPSRIQDQATRFRPSAQEHASGQEDNGLQCHPELQRAKIEAVHLRDLLGGSPAIFAPYAVREESQQLSHMSSAPAVGEARPPPDAAAPEVAQGPKLLKAFCYEELDYADDDEEEEDEFDVMDAEPTPDETSEAAEEPKDELANEAKATLPSASLAKAVSTLPSMTAALAVVGLVLAVGVAYYFV